MLINVSVKLNINYHLLIQVNYYLLWIPASAGMTGGGSCYVLCVYSPNSPALDFIASKQISKN
jgi:hypothetical protein